MAWLQVFGLVFGAVICVLLMTTIGYAVVLNRKLSLLRDAKRDMEKLFGEYVPLKRFLPFLHTIARMAGSFSPAESVRLLDWRDERIGPSEVPDDETADQCPEKSEQAGNEGAPGTDQSDPRNNFV